MPCSGVSVAKATSSWPFATQWRRLNVLSFPPETSPMTLCLTPGMWGTVIDLPLGPVGVILRSLCASLGCTSR